MKITAIGFRNFAGATSQVAFHGGRTALIGPNGAGKTRILQAIRVALCGYDPELGKKGNAGLACGDPMVVTLELCDDAHPPKTLTIRREFHATEAGGMKETVSLLPNRGEKTKAAADARILKTLGSQTTAVDLGALLSATAGQRAAKLAELVGDQADVTADTFVSKLRTAGELPDAQTQEIANAWDAQETIAANLETSLKVLAGATSEAAAREKEATATVRRLEEEVSGLGAPAKALPELEAERDAAQARAGELRTEIGADTERGARLATLQSSTADAEAGLARWVTMTAAAVEELADTEKTLAAAMEEDADAKAIPEVKVPDPVPPRLVEKVESLVAYVKAAEGEVERAHNRLAEAIASAGPHQSCPVSKGVRCPIPNDVSDGQARDRSRLEAGKADAREALDVLKADLDAAVIELNAAKAAHRKRAYDAHDLDQKRRDALSRAALGAARADSAREGALKVEQSAQEMLRAAKGSRDHLVKELAAAPGRLDVEELKKRLEVDDAQVATLNTQIRTVSQAKALRGQLIASEESGAEAREAATTLRALQKRAKAAVGEILESAMAPVMGRVGALLKLVEPDWTLKAAGAGGGVEFQVDTGKGSAPWTGLSGGELVVFTAALALALVRLQETPARYLFLEAAELDPERLETFLAALAEMGGDFDSILVASCHAPDPPAAAPWLVHQVGA